MSPVSHLVGTVACSSLLISPQPSELAATAVHEILEPGVNFDSSRVNLSCKAEPEMPPEAQSARWKAGRCVCREAKQAGRQAGGRAGRQACGRAVLDT